MYKTIGNRLKKIRLDNKLTVEQLSEIMEVKSRTIGSYERNENRPSLEYLEKFAEKFDLDLNWIIKGEKITIESDKTINIPVNLELKDLSDIETLNIILKIKKN